MINVHLIASKKNVLQDIVTLRRINDIVKKDGHDILDDWIEVAYDIRVKQDRSDVDWPGIYRASLENIAKADVVIAETTFDTFGVGYQIANVVHQKKPVLMLRHENAAEEDAFANGIVDSWVQRETYNNDNLAIVIGKFLEENDIATKDMRFNFFIDRPIYNFLRWTALKTGKTKAEILRELVMHEINNKDKI